MIKQILLLKEVLNKQGYQLDKLEHIISIAQRIYVVKPGDTLYKISGGDIAYQKLIEKANPGLDPSKLNLGQKIIMPPKPISPNESMQPSSKAISLIKKYEGVPNTGEPYLIPYDDGFGNVTAGWGHNYGKGDPKRYKHLTYEKAQALLLEDLSIATAFIKRNVNVKLSQSQFDALTSLIFNAGGTKVFRTELFKAINSGDFGRAKQLFPSVLIGKNQGGLVQRRKDETNLFSS